MICKIIETKNGVRDDKFIFDYLRVCNWTRPTSTTSDMRSLFQV